MLLPWLPVSFPASCVNHFHCKSPSPDPRMLLRLWMLATWVEVPHSWQFIDLSNSPLQDSPLGLVLQFSMRMQGNMTSNGFGGPVLFTVDGGMLLGWCAFHFSFDVSTSSLTAPVKANLGAVVLGKTKETMLWGDVDNFYDAAHAWFLCLGHVNNHFIAYELRYSFSHLHPIVVVKMAQGTVIIDNFFILETHVHYCT